MVRDADDLARRLGIGFHAALAAVEAIALCRSSDLRYDHVALKTGCYSNDVEWQGIYETPSGDAEVTVALPVATQRLRIDLITGRADPRLLQINETNEKRPTPADVDREIERLHGLDDLQAGGRSDRSTPYHYTADVGICAKTRNAPAFPGRREKLAGALGVLALGCLWAFGLDAIGLHGRELDVGLTLVALGVVFSVVVIAAGESRS